MSASRWTNCARHAGSSRRWRSPGRSSGLLEFERETAVAAGAGLAFELAEPAALVEADRGRHRAVCLQLDAGASRGPRVREGDLQELAAEPAAPPVGQQVHLAELAARGVVGVEPQP